MPNVYIVKLELELPIVAESEQEARELANRHWQDEYVSEDDFYVLPMSYVVGDLEDLVWHDLHEDSPVKDISVEDALKLPGGYLHKVDTALGASLPQTA